MNVLFIENKYYIIYLCCPRKIKNADREIRTLKINLASKTSSYANSDISAKTKHIIFSIILSIKKKYCCTYAFNTPTRSRTQNRWI